MRSAKHDTFFSYNSEDRSLVDALAHRLLAENIKPWLDKWDIVPGELWQSEIEKALESCASCCVFIGRSGLGPWQTEEMRVAIDRRVNAPGTFRVIPIVLPGVNPKTLREMPRFLTATSGIVFKESIEDTETFRHLVCGIRGQAPGPSPIYQSSLETRTTQGPELADLSWTRQALTSDAVVQFLFGALHLPPSPLPEMCHYVAALIEKYCYLLSPIVADTEQPYIAKARQTLIENGCLFAPRIEGSLEPEPKPALKVLVSAASEIPESFPMPNLWIGTSRPTQLDDKTKFYSCDVRFALIRILVHCAGETHRDDELQKDLLCLPSHVGEYVRFLVQLFWPEEKAGAYSFMELPKVQEASRAALTILFPESSHTGQIPQPNPHPVLVSVIEALRRCDIAFARKLRKELTAGAKLSPDASIEPALAYIDASIAMAEGNDASAERILRNTFRASMDPGSGCNLALLLCWYGRYAEAKDVLRGLEAPSPSATEALLLQIINQWIACRTTSQNADGWRPVIEDLVGQLAQSGDGQALLWHVLSAACLDIGLIDTSIECAEKATRKDSGILEYRIQRAIALLHRFPTTPADYQKREPFPVRDREPIIASELLESVLSDSGINTTGHFIGRVHHLLGIAYYCAAVATLNPRDRLRWFSLSGKAFSKAQEMIGGSSYQLAGYAGQALLRAREFRKACTILESIPPEGRSKSCETAFIVALAIDNRVDDAVAEVKLALERSELSAEAIANVSMIVLQCGLPDDAKRLLRLAVTGLARSSWIVHFLLGRAHIDLGEFEDAEHELWRSISLNSTEPRLYSAHLLAFDQHIACQAKTLLLEVRGRSKGIKVDAGFLSEFERRVEHEVEAYREHVNWLNRSTTPGSTVIAKSFEPIRRSVDELRRVVIALGKLLQDPEVRDAEVFVATVRILLGVAKRGKSDPVETLLPTSPAIDGEPWVEFQRTLSQDSSWSKVGLRLDDSGAEILAHILDSSQQSIVPHWLHLAARQVDVEARGKRLRAYSGTQGVERKPYQEAVVRRAKLRNYGRIILADEVGLGKTIEACLIFSEYRERGLVESCLILVPSRELGQQWERELTEKFQLRREGTTELGRYRTTGWSGFDGHEVCILTYQAAIANAQAVIERKWDMVICDEAHHLTNRGSERFKLLKALRNKVPYLLLLTATPMQRQVEDLYSLSQLIRPSMFSSLKDFRERYCNPRDPRQIRHAGDLVRRLSEIMVRNRAGAVSSEALLGRRRFNDFNVSLDRHEREFYEGIEALIFKAYKPGRSGKPPLAYYSLARAASSSPMAALNWLENLAKDPAVSAEAKELLDVARHLTPMSKLRELKNLLSLSTSETEHVIVFTDYRTTARCIADSVGGILIDSRLTDRQLGQRLETFRTGGEGRILVATPRLSEGLNLQFCHNIVNFDLPWNPFKIEQRIGRVHRVGQHSPEVFISTLSASDTIEQLIKEFLQSKLRMFESVVGRMTHQIFEFESGGTIEEQIKEILSRVESRKQLRGELDGLSLEHPILTHDPQLSTPPKTANISLYLDQAWHRFSTSSHND